MKPAVMAHVPYLMFYGECKHPRERVDVNTLYESKSESPKSPVQRAMDAAEAGNKAKIQDE